jgi:folylpolyglutamate synthase
MPATNGKPDLRGTPSIVGMSEWLQMMGYSDEDLNALNVIHIAGTKGKGSTCAFTESMLRSHGRRTGFPRKTGLYTSPHLLRPEERIRINSEPLEPALLAKYFFEMYDRLPQLSEDYDPSKEVVDRGPRYLQLWALLAFHVFVREKVDAAIFETHNGGEYDATNVVKRPVVTAVTTLGMDHIEMLGPSLENIAWHKSGIYKSGAVALSTVQEPAPGQVLEQRAAAKGEKLRVAGIDPRLPKDALKLKPVVQQKNASLAAAVAQAYLEQTVGDDQVKFQLTSVDIASGVEQFAWPGRFQVVPDGQCTWFLDAAHNNMSVAIAARWFLESGHEMEHNNEKIVRVLIFSHINELRDTATLLENLATALQESDSGVQHVIFSTYDESEERKARRQGESPELFHRVWRSIHPDTKIWDETTIQGAMERARRLGEGYDGVQTLITGSQHLVGPALRVLQARDARL